MRKLDYFLKKRLKKYKLEASPTPFISPIITIKFLQKYIVFILFSKKTSFEERISVCINIL